MILRCQTVIFSSFLFVLAQGASGKGLEDLSGQNPEVQPEEQPVVDDATDTTDTETTPPAAVSQEPVSYAGPVHQKLSVSTSFGWVSASRSKGDWRGNGVSDIAVGYRITTFSPKLALIGTYRYAPVNVVGEVEGQSYRGVWEAHYFGSKAEYKLNSRTILTGGMEVGYVLVYLSPSDGLETKKAHEENGVSVTLGGGADFLLSENGAFSAGPRLYAGFGSFTTIQLGASAGFMF